MDITKLQMVAQQMVAPGKGILAADESTNTIGKKLAKVGLESTELMRRSYREMLFTSPGIGTFISGVIMYDETIRQSDASGTPFVQLMQNEGILPGIKVDTGTKDMDGSPNEKLTTGLDGLPHRLAEYAKLGAKFAKWRAVITIGDGIPTDANLHQNAKDLAAYAKMCQAADIVPMVEPEVLMDADNTLERCAEVSEKNLSYLFEELKSAGVDITGIILKTNMVVPGKKCPQQKSADEIADATVALFRKVLPDNLPGQAFLSGGQSDLDATANLNAVNKRGPFPWRISFSYGRALQDTALQTWSGKPENVEAAQNVFLHRARMNSLATLGEYTPEDERSA